MGLSVIVLFLVTLTVQANAQEKKQKMTKEVRVEGRVALISKDKSSITVAKRGNVRQTVFYNNNTQFTYRNKPASFDDVKDGRRVICLGKYEEKDRLVASRIDVRDK
jgi:hypothetical protein